MRAPRVNTRPLKLMSWVELERVALDAGLSTSAVRKAPSLTHLRLAIKCQRGDK